jgi:hypothetical protein
MLTPKKNTGQCAMMETDSKQGVVEFYIGFSSQQHNNKQGIGGTR